MGFIMDGLDAEAYDRSYSDGELVRRILAYFKPHWPVMVFVAAVILANSLVDALLPLLISRGIDALGEQPSFGVTV